MTDLVPDPGAPLAVSPELRDAARAFVNASKSPNTRRAYAADWRRFVAWCERVGAVPLPAAPDALALYLSHLATDGSSSGGPLKASTIGRALSGISAAHLLAGHPSPRGGVAVQSVWRGIRSTLGLRPDQAVPLLAGEIREAVRRLPPGLRSTRDRALLLVGFAGAFRRGELVALDAEHLVFVERGVEALKVRSKTDQEARGEKVWIPWGTSDDVCPVRALRAWLDAASITTGPVFRPLEGPGANDQVLPRRLGDRAVVRVVKRAARLLGLDPRRYKGHSLRSGFVTSATIAGKGEGAIMRQTGHTSPQMVRRYIREVDGWRDNAAAGLL